MRPRTKKTLGSVITAVGLAGTIYGVCELPRENEPSNKKIWEDTYPTKPWEVVGGSLMISIVGWGLLASYNESREKERIKNELIENDYRDSVSYYNLEDL